MKLVDHFQYGLNSPICLTWELTYACNLACVHCLSSSGRRDPRELLDRRGASRWSTSCSGCRSSTSTSAAASRRCARTSGSCSTTRSATTSASSSPPTGSSSTRRGRRSWRRPTTSTSRSRSTGRRGGQRLRPRPGLVRHRDAGVGEPGRGRVRPAEDLGGDDAAERGSARRVQGDRRQVRRAAADHPAASVGAGCGRVGRAAPHRGAAAHSSTTGWSPAARAC